MNNYSVFIVFIAVGVLLCIMSSIFVIVNTLTLLDTIQKGLSFVKMVFPITMICFHSFLLFMNGNTIYSNIRNCMTRKRLREESSRLERLIHSINTQIMNNQRNGYNGR